MVSCIKKWAAVLAAAAGVFCVSCNKEQVAKVITVGFASAEAEFNNEGKATVSLELTPAALQTVSVSVAVGSSAQEGFTAIAAKDLTFNENVEVAVGSTTASFEVSVDLDAVDSKHQAVLTIAGANGATVNSEKATVYIKAPEIAKPADLSGANVWGIIGGFNDWASDVEMTKTADDPETWEVKNVALSGEFKFRGNKEWGNYDLGASSAPVIGEPLDLVHKGSNITIAEGTYDVVLKPTLQTAVFTASAAAPTAGTLKWEAKYKGCAWVEGYYSDGQLEQFEVSKTDVSKFYAPMVIDLSEAEDAIAILSGEGAADFIAEQQAAITDEVSLYVEYLGMTVEEVIAGLFYNETNDGTEVLMSGLAAGDYQFIVLSMSAQGELDGNWLGFGFTKTTSAEEEYDWGLTPNLKSNWTATWNGWVEGQVSKEFYISGKAEGAAYVLCQWYTEDEITDYYGSLEGMLNTYATNMKDNVFFDPIDDCAIKVAADGNFDTTLRTYSTTGPVDVYIIGFDAQGNCLGDYGKSSVTIPEPDPINWVERTDWAGNYDASVDTGEADYPLGLVITACDAEYFITTVLDAGTLEAEGIDYAAEDALYYIQNYGFATVLEAGLIHTSVPATEAWKNLNNGDEFYIFGVTDAGELTGEYHMETLKGIEEIVVPPVELTLVPEWSVTPTGAIFKDADGYDKIAVTLNLPGIKYYIAEENNQDDLDYYYGGSVEGLGKAYESKLASYLSQGYTMDELIYSASSPLESIYVYNTDTPTAIYVVEFDENGKFTGRYGATNVTISSTATASISKSSVAKAKGNKTSLKVAGSSKPQMSRPVIVDVRKSVKVNNPVMDKITRKAAPSHKKGLVAKGFEK